MNIGNKVADLNITIYDYSQYIHGRTVRAQFSLEIKMFVIMLMTVIFCIQRTLDNTQ